MNHATIFVLVVALLVTVSALPKHDPPRLPRPIGGNPNFGGYGSFNPRGRRSPGGSISIDQPINQDPKVSAGWVEKVYENEYGSIVTFGEVNKSPNKKTEGVGGIRGEFHWGGPRKLSSAQQDRLLEIYRATTAEQARRDAIDRERKAMKLN